MHYVGFELLESRRFAPPLEGITALATPRDDVAFVCVSGRVILLSRGEEPRLLRLPPGLAPEFLVECPGDEILVVHGGGQAATLSFCGDVVREFDLGPRLGDAATDEFGIFVLRRTGRLEKFSLDGRAMEDSQVAHINSGSRAEDGTILLAPYDGSVWLNLEEHFDEEGKSIAHIDAASIFGEGRVSGDLLGDSGIVVLTEDGRLMAVDERGNGREARLPREAVRRVLGRDLTARLDCLATRGELLTILSTDLSALTMFELYSE